MKATYVVPMIAAFAGIVRAKALLAVFPSEVTVGKTYQVEWLADAIEV